MTGNIIGEEFEGWVRDEIRIRQQNQFGGFDSSRTPEQLQYLTNRNAWVKLASSVKILPDTYITSYPKAGNDYMMYQDPIYNTEEWQNTPIEPIKTRKPSGGEAKLKNIFGNESYSNFLDTGLAKNAILFNTISNLDKTLSNNRAGITKTTNLWNNTSAYGIGGTDYGIQPPPGIISVQVDSLNRGSIRKANVTLKAHNKFQFDIIELLYLRLGYSMMLEWGWDRFLTLNGKKEDVGNTIIEEEWFTTNGTTQLQMINLIETNRIRYSGNYDGFFGKVSNFTWDFNSDGSYDISIDLITIGDVVESLKVNTAPQSQFKLNNEGQLTINGTDFGNLKETPIAEAALNNSIGLFLWGKTIEMENSGSLKTSIDGGINYLILNNLGTRETEYTENNSTATIISVSTKTNEEIITLKPRYKYYIRFDELLIQLKNIIVPLIKNEGPSKTPQITFETSLSYATYFPNQISLDPKVCLIKPFLNYGDIEGINDPSSSTLESLPQYVIDRGDGYIYGSLMKLFINFDFISQLVTNNTDPSQDFSLYKFLQGLCDGINNALGGVNKLEPVIKDDYVITIIDQTLSEYTPDDQKTDTVDLEIYGYSPDRYISNFVKDIKFQSKITPQLASMISIGATAAGSSVSSIDGTAFSKWSEGLVDRFSQEILEPNGLGNTKVGVLGDESKYREKYNKYENIFDRYDRWWLEGTDLENYDVSTPQKAANKKYIEKRLKELEKRLIKDPDYPDYINTKILSFEEYYALASEYDKTQKNLGNFTIEEIDERVKVNYAIYLAFAFGGSPGGIKVRTRKGPKPFQNPQSESRYFNLDDIFISQGKSAYKTYINNLNNTRFEKESIPSSEVGFIPLSFDLTLEGISGIKIYNKLNINNKFLPSNYPESLNFIITKVNHRIENNSWDTSLSTISIPKTKPYKFISSPTVESGKPTTNTWEDTEIIGPQPTKEPFIIEQGGKTIELETLISQLDPVAQPLFRNFFKILSQEYGGYKAIITSVRRTWYESSFLKAAAEAEGADAATPGFSAHNYGLALDMNIVTPRGEQLKYGDGRNWVREGIIKRATDNKLRWGGNFGNRRDTVHFDLELPQKIAAARNNILKQAKEKGVNIESLDEIQYKKIDELIDNKEIKYTL